MLRNGYVTTWDPSRKRRGAGQGRNRVTLRGFCGTDGMKGASIYVLGGERMLCRAS